MYLTFFRCYGNAFLINESVTAGKPGIPNFERATIQRRLLRNNIINLDCYYRVIIVSVARIKKPWQHVTGCRSKPDAGGHDATQPIGATASPLWTGSTLPRQHPSPADISRQKRMTTVTMVLTGKDRWSHGLPHLLCKHPVKVENAFAAFGHTAVGAGGSHTLEPAGPAGDPEGTLEGYGLRRHAGPGSLERAK